MAWELSELGDRVAKLEAQMDAALARAGVAEAVASYLAIELANNDGAQHLEKIFAIIDAQLDRPDIRVGLRDAARRELASWRETVKHQRATHSGSRAFDEGPRPSEL